MAASAHLGGLPVESRVQSNMINYKWTWAVCTKSLASPSCPAYRVPHYGGLPACYTWLVQSRRVDAPIDLAMCILRAARNFAGPAAGAMAFWLFSAGGEGVEGGDDCGKTWSHRSGGDDTVFGTGDEGLCDGVCCSLLGEVWRG
jgi:hypothetical protein